MRRNYVRTLVFPLRQSKPIGLTKKRLLLSIKTYLAYLVVGCLVFCSSCQDLNPPPETISEEALTFFTISTPMVEKTDLLDIVKVTGSIDEGDCLPCLEEFGLFYSTSKDTLFNDNSSYQSLLTATGVFQREIPQDSLNRSNNGDTNSTYSYTFKLPKVGTTYFFRSYAIFNNNSVNNQLERTYLSDEIDPTQITLNGGWYKYEPEIDSDLWLRKGAFAVNYKPNAVIIGTGCTFTSLCASNIKEQPFLELQFSGDDITIGTKSDCPFDSFLDSPIHNNRENPIAFNLGEMVYFGTGRIDNAGSKDVYGYHPDQCDTDDPIVFNLPDTFTPREGAVGFSINGYGYIGLGREFEGIDIDKPLTDFWQLNPTTEVWSPLTITGVPNLDDLKRSNAVIVETNDDGSIIFGGGFVEFGATRLDFWKFTPDPINLTVAVEPAAKVPTLGTDGDGISFTIDGTPYAGLGNLNNSFFKWQNEAWVAAPDFPGLPIFGGVAFSIDNRGYLFTGTKNDNTVTRLSQDLWIYVPE